MLKFSVDSSKMQRFEPILWDNFFTCFDFCDQWGLTRNVLVMPNALKIALTQQWIFWFNPIYLHVSFFLYENLYAGIDRFYTNSRINSTQDQILLPFLIVCFVTAVTTQIFNVLSILNIQLHFWDSYECKYTFLVIPIFYVVMTYKSLLLFLIGFKLYP